MQGRSPSKENAARKMQKGVMNSSFALTGSNRGAQPSDRRALWSREVIAVEAGCATLIQVKAFLSDVQLNC
jgi:hypothetical protein